MKQNPFNSLYITINSLKLPSYVEEKVVLKIKISKGSASVSRSYEYSIRSKKQFKCNFPLYNGTTMTFKFKFGSKKWYAALDLSGVLNDELIQTQLDLKRENVAEGKIKVSYIIPGKHYDIMEDIKICTRWVEGKYVLCLVKFSFTPNFVEQSQKTGIEGNNILYTEIPTPVEKNIAKIVKEKESSQDHLIVEVNSIEFKKKVKGTIKMNFCMLNKDRVKSNYSESIKFSAKDMKNIKKRMKLPIYLDSVTLFCQIFSQGGFMSFSRKNLGAFRYNINPLKHTPDKTKVDLSILEMKKQRGKVNLSMKLNFSQEDLFQEKEIIRNVINVKKFYTKNSGVSSQIFKTISYSHFNAERFAQMNKGEIEVICFDCSPTIKMKQSDEGSIEFDNVLVLNEFSECYKVWYKLKDPSVLESEEFFIEYKPSAPVFLENELYNEEDLPSAPIFEEFYEPSAPDF